MKLWLVATIAALAVGPGPAYAHGGGTDANGCHTNRKTGDYHCHTPKGGSASPALQSTSPRAVSGGATIYPNCAAARAAGAAPLRRGQAGYRPALDRDSDGVACE